MSAPRGRRKEGKAGRKEGRKARRRRRRALKKGGSEGAREERAPKMREERGKSRFLFAKRMMDEILRIGRLPSSASVVSVFLLLFCQFRALQKWGRSGKTERRGKR